MLIHLLIMYKPIKDDLLKPLLILKQEATIAYIQAKICGEKERLKCSRSVQPEVSFTK